MEKYIIDKNQVNTLLQLIQEIPLKQSIRQYQVLQTIMQTPYIEPIEENSKEEAEIEK